ncbi:hypothetical protein E2562_019136 [Oryza meyeriana var. granulata]|uniref:J domain-containing protein n=1 Tax=Oryza meyeriana var. granulata TaxID=110450 RepID=A0A6G1CRX8_9ORYZ|nr:hypothetical protein E2562_019136 [Oryza meyeriana var. granulata]
MAAGGVLCVSTSSSSAASAAARGQQRGRGRGRVEVRCSSVAAGGPVEEHYRTLRLPPGATKGEVKKAFRRLALMVRTCQSRRISGVWDFIFSCKLFFSSEVGEN